MTELEKDAAELLFALHDAWPYVHQWCTIESKKKNIQRLIRKHGDFADLFPEQQEPEIVQRVKRFAGKTMRTARNPNITARECIELANWIVSNIRPLAREPEQPAQSVNATGGPKAHFSLAEQPAPVPEAHKQEPVECMCGICKLGKREWNGLTDVEWMNIVNKHHAWFGFAPEDVAHEVCKLTETKLKENNT